MPTRSIDNTGAGSEITIQRDGPWICVSDPPAALLELLRTERTVSGVNRRRSALDRLRAAVNGGNVGDGDRDVPESAPALSRPWRLFHPTPRPQVIAIRAGLTDVVVGFFLERGVTVRFDGGISPLPVWDYERATRVFATVDDALLAAVRDRPGVLVRHGPEVDPVRLFAQLALVIRSRTVLVCGRRQEVTRAIRQLRWLGLEARAAYGDGRMCQDGPDDTTWVATWRGLAQPYVDARRASVVVLMNAREALGETPIERVMTECRGRLVGLLPIHERLSRYEADRLWEILVAPPLFIPAHGAVRRTVRVVWSRMDGPVVPRELNGVDLLRRGVWGNPARNRRAARLARLLVSGPADELTRRFPDVAAGLGGRAVRRVLILVASLEHAAALAGLLPDAAVVCARGALLPAGLVAQTRVPESGVAIITADALAVGWLADRDVLVRLDGGTELPPGVSPDHLISNAAADELLVADFDDRHHPVLRRRSRDREQAYHAAGWAVGADRRLDALRAFRATRPPEGRR